MRSPYTPLTSGVPPVSPSVPPFRPMYNCLSCPRTSPAPFVPPRVNASAVYSFAAGGPGQPSNTLAGGVPTRPPSPAHLIPATITADRGASPKAAGDCGCGGHSSGMKWWEIGLMILGGLVVLRAVVR